MPDPMIILNKLSTITPTIIGTHCNWPMLIVHN